MDYTKKADELKFTSDPAYRYTVTAKKIYKEDYGKYTMVGVLRNKNTRKVYMDIFDRLFSVSKSAGILFNKIRQARDPDTGISIMPEWKSLKPTQRREINRRLAELREVDLVLKIQHIKGAIIPPAKFSYIINPHYIKPWHYEEAKKIWKDLKINSENEVLND